MADIVSLSGADRRGSIRGCSLEDAASRVRMQFTSAIFALSYYEARGPCSNGEEQIAKLPCEHVLASQSDCSIAIVKAAKRKSTLIANLARKNS